VSESEVETVSDDDENDGLIGEEGNRCMLPWYSTEGAGERPDDEGSTGEGVGDKHTRT
jgi:hypothetical protein